MKKHIIYENIDVESFLKACANFEKFRHNLDTEQNKAGAIQAFEYCYEISWKTLKKILLAKGKYERTPRDCFREGASAGIISNPKAWFEFLKKRNLTVHTDNEQVVDEIIAIFDDFSDALK